MLVREPWPRGPDRPDPGGTTDSTDPVTLRAFELGELASEEWERPLQALSASLPEGAFAPWGFDLGERRPTTEGLQALLEARPRFVVLTVNLLTATAILPVAKALADSGIGVFASDPFAGGHLNGGFLNDSPLERGPVPRPLDWQALRRQLAPVLALGFLTEGGRRTLPQAALDFAAGAPGVVSVLVPVRQPLDLRAAAEGWGNAALSEQERTRVIALGRRGSGSAAGAAGRIGSNTPDR